jgi:putative glycerol-1-phosphate prenyltransferase
MDKDNVNAIVDTALAAQLMGKWMIYLEAGSGASFAITPAIIRAVRKQVSIPLIVGGGIRTEAQLNEAHQAGADMVVMGNVFEKTDHNGIIS